MKKIIVTEISNGYTVSTYEDDKEIDIFYCENIKDAIEIVSGEFNKIIV